MFDTVTYPEMIMKLPREATKGTEYERKQAVKYYSYHHSTEQKYNLCFICLPARPYLLISSSKHELDLSFNTSVSAVEAGQDILHTDGTVMWLTLLLLLPPFSPFFIITCSAATL